VIPAVFLIKTLVQQSYLLFVLVKQKLAEGLFVNCHQPLCETIRALGQDPTVSYQIQEIVQKLATTIIEKGSTFLMSFPKIVINLFVLFFTLFYFLKDGEVLLSRLNHYLSLQKKEYVLILSRLREIIRGIVFGHLLVALIQGALGALGFFLFGVSSPLFWGLLMALFALIPYLGTGIIWLPASLILFFEGVFQNSNSLMLKGIGLFLYGLLVVSTVDNLLKPKLIGEQAKVHPLVILLGIFGGMFFFGALGVIIGPLILSFTTAIIETYLHRRGLATVK
jgi:predicted PurR-regulated permease PerM